MKSLSNVFDGINTTVRKKFQETNVYTKPECNDCWAKFYCSGGCAVMHGSSTTILQFHMI